MKGANLSLSPYNIKQLNVVWVWKLYMADNLKKIHSKRIERIIFSKSVNKILATVPGKKTSLIW